MEKTLEGARPACAWILMTSFAFILGCVLPCGLPRAPVRVLPNYGTAVFAHAGRERNRTFLIPCDFHLVEKWSGAGEEHASAAVPATPAPALGD